MNLTLGAIGLGILALIGGGIFLLTFGKRSGTAKAAADVAEKTVKVQQAQAQAQADAPQGKTSVIDRLRKGGGL